MKTNKATQKLNQLPWELMIKAIELEEYKQQLDEISDVVFDFVLSEATDEELVETSLEALKKVDPDKANLEYAARVVDYMKVFAKQELNRRNTD